MRKYIDIGVNLTASSFSKDVPAVIERALEAGVAQMVVTGTSARHSEQALQLSQQYESVCYATAGLHPHHASDYSAELVSELRDILKHDNVVAVGECGLEMGIKFFCIKPDFSLWIKLNILVAHLQVGCLCLAVTEYFSRTRQSLSQAGTRSSLWPVRPEQLG